MTIEPKDLSIFLTSMNITTLGLKEKIQIVVNSANPSLAGIGEDLTHSGGGIDGAIHRAAGISLYESCMKFEKFDGVTSNLESNGSLSYDVARKIRCAHGDLRITDAFNLPYQKVFHAVSPRFINGEYGEIFMLENLYRRIYSTMIAYQYSSIVIPPLGTSSYGMSKEASASIAFNFAVEFSKSSSIKTYFSASKSEDFKLYAAAFEKNGMNDNIIY